jgi:hypothetical protein
MVIKNEGPADFLVQKADLIAVIDGENRKSDSDRVVYISSGVTVEVTDACGKFLAEKFHGIKVITPEIPHADEPGPEIDKSLDTGSGEVETAFPSDEEKREPNPPVDETPGPILSQDPAEPPFEGPDPEPPDPRAEELPEDRKVEEPAHEITVDDIPQHGNPISPAEGNQPAEGADKTPAEDDQPKIIPVEDIPAVNPSGPEYIVIPAEEKKGE